MNTSVLSGSRGRTSCRFCGEGVLHPFVDLGVSPPCETFLTAQDLEAGERFFPLDVRVCSSCWLAQLGEFVPPEEIFTEYAYFSSYSQAWLTHACTYSGAMVERFGLGQSSFVIEVASNDGYLLRNFVARDIPCLGIEPAANVARVAIEAGVPTQVAFFGRDLAEELAATGRRADLIAGNNVLAQVPDLNNFVAGLTIALKDEGVLTLEFPHLLKMIAENQFDTIYHEHFSYFSLISVGQILAAHGLRVFDVEELWPHGGSLRIFACRPNSRHAETARVAQLRSVEQAAGLHDLSTYAAFSRRVVDTKRKLLELLIEIKRQGKRITGYGAPGKGNTLLNYCGIRTDFLDFTVDRNPYKHGRFLPGTRIPVLPPECLDMARPDYVLILPWNLRDEIMTQLAHIREWGGRFIVPIPDPVVVN
jgi:C-methyltransferase C-terminal domain/Putative zinc binding domain/Methyltransferase domain